MKLTKTQLTEMIRESVRSELLTEARGSYKWDSDSFGYLYVRANIDAGGDLYISLTGEGLDESKKKLLAQELTEKLGVEVSGWDAERENELVFYIDVMDGAPMITQAIIKMLA